MMQTRCLARISRSTVTTAALLLPLPVLPRRPIWLSSAADGIGGSAIREFQQHVGVTGMVQAAKTGEVFAGERGDPFSEARVIGRLETQQVFAIKRGCKTMAGQNPLVGPEYGIAGLVVHKTAMLGQTDGGGVVNYIERERIAPLARPADINRVLGHAPTFGAGALDALRGISHRRPPHTDRRASRGRQAQYRRACTALR